jgi:hypothetical protein
MGERRGNLDPLRTSSYLFIRSQRKFQLRPSFHKWENPQPREIPSSVRVESGGAFNNTVDSKMNFRAQLLVAFFLVGADVASSAPLLPEKIAYQKASTQQVIPFRDGVLVECDYYAADSVMYAQFDQKETSILKIDGIQRLLDVEPSSEGVLLFGLNEIDGQVTCSLVRESAAGGRAVIDLPEGLRCLRGEIQHTNIPRLIGTNDAAALMLGDEVHWLDKAWHSRRLPKVPQFHDEFVPKTFGDTHFLDGTTLYAGWDHGEWGGMLAALDLSDTDSKWVHLSGKPLGDTTGIPQNNPIHSIISPKKGEIWVATGLAHLGGTWRGLHHRDSVGKWHTLIDGESEDDRGSMKLPFPSSIQGIATDNSGQIYVLAGEVGVLRLTNGRMDRLIDHNFFSHSSDRGDHTVGCDPSTLGIARNGDVFVSTNSFGVLAFRKEADGWTARQIEIKKRDNKPSFQTGDHIRKSSPR